MNQTAVSLPQSGAYLWGAKGAWATSLNIFMAEIGKIFDIEHPLKQCPRYANGVRFRENPLHKKYSELSLSRLCKGPRKKIDLEKVRNREKENSLECPDRDR